MANPSVRMSATSHGRMAARRTSVALPAAAGGRSGQTRSVDVDPSELSLVKTWQHRELVQWNIN